MTSATTNYGFTLLEVGQTQKEATINLGLQAIDAQLLAPSLVDAYTPVTGFTHTIANAKNILLLTPAATIATGTVTMPAAPVQNQVVEILTSHTVTAFTLSMNTGQTLVGTAPTTLAVGTELKLLYNGTSWYRML